MLQNKQAHRSKSMMLQQKRDVFEKMLELLHGLKTQAPENINLEETQDFSVRMDILITESSRLDHYLQNDPAEYTEEDKKVIDSIHLLADKIKTENSNLIASARASQNAIGEQTKKLRVGKNMLNKYLSNIVSEPTLVDEDL